MPQFYTIATKNAFAALDDPSDQEDVILSEAPADVVTQQSQANTQRQPRQQIGSKSQGKKESQHQSAAAAPRTTNRRADQQQQQQQQHGFPKRSNKNAGDSPIDTGYTKPPSMREPPATRKEYQDPKADRRSGTGRGREMKKDGGGAHNWGNEPADFGGDDGNTKITREDGSGQEEEPEQVAAAAENTDEAPKAMSYADYKANVAAMVEAPFAEKEVAKSDKKVEQGYQVYTKDVEGSITKPSHYGEEEKARPKSMHLAELAAQNGVPFRFQGGSERRPRRQQDGPRSNTRNSGKPQQLITAPAGEHEINLSDTQAFPTL